MSARQASWLMLLVAAGVTILIWRGYQAWNQPDLHPLDDRAKYRLSRACTDAQGWPEVSDYAVTCHDFQKELHVHLRAHP